MMSLRRHFQNKTFANRLFFLACIKVLLLFVLCGRLYYLQVTHYTKYQTLAEDNRLDTKLLLPPRGMIYDRQGVLLAGTEKKYQLLLTMKKKAALKSLWPQLEGYVDDNLTFEKTYLKMRKDMRNPIVLKNDLNYEEILKIESVFDDMKGMSIEPVHERIYPFGDLMTSALGYIGPLSKRDLEKNEDYKELPRRIKIGKEGLERTFDEVLRGQPGMVTHEVNARGVVLRDLDREESLRGTALNLTLDHEIQQLCYDKLKDHVAGTIVGLDVHTGEVYCFASHPTYDPKLFMGGISQDNWQGLLNNPLKPLVHRATQGLYAPGSIFKAITALAALEGGYVRKDEKIFCGGHHEVGNHRLHCWRYHGGHGKLDLEEAIEQSCDVFFYIIAGRMGIEPIMDMARRFGLGERTTLELSGQKSGLLPSHDWKMKTHKKPLYKSEVMMMSIGQSYLLASPLQLAQMMGRLVNGGKAVTPYLSKEKFKQGQIVKRTARLEDMGLRRENLDLVRRGFVRVFNSPKGTAYRQRVREKGYEMGGKSSTTQVRRISKKERQTGVIKNDKLDWKLRDHGMFFGFAPAHDPRFAVSVIIEHGGGGSRVAAPIARDILLALQKKYRS